MNRWVVLAISLALAAGCGTNNVVPDERAKIGTVTFLKPVEKEGALRVVTHLAVGDPSKGTDYKSLTELHKELYKTNNIVIADIVSEKLKGQKKIGRLKVVSANGDITVSTTILRYGFGPGGPFTKKMSPELQLLMTARTRDGREVWSSTGTTTVWSSVGEAVDPFEQVKNPEAVRAQLRAVAENSASLALKSLAEF